MIASVMASSFDEWCRQQELNPRHPRYKGGALPTELCRRKLVAAAELNRLVRLMRPMIAPAILTA